MKGLFRGALVGILLLPSTLLAQAWRHVRRQDYRKEERANLR